MAVSERMSKRRQLPTAATAVTVALAILAASAAAGEYHVYSCRTPAGESAPADGWSESKTGAESVTANTCAQPGGALVAGLGDQTTHVANVDRAAWTLELPEIERLVGATLWRAGYVHGGTDETGTYEFLLAGPIGTDVFGQCLYVNLCDELGRPGTPFFGTNSVVVPVANLGGQLSLSTRCATALPEGQCQDDFGDPNGYAAVVYLYAADLTVEQSSGPTASNVSGELASAPTVAGTSDVVFSASDPGSGVYEAVFSVDGQVVQSTVVDEDGGRCRNVGETTDGLGAFLYVQPCPPSVSADVGFDTTRVSNGTHHLVVSVIDAAGNAATVLDRDITVDNPPPPGTPPRQGAPGGPNGRNASARATLTVGWKGTRSARLASAFGRAGTIVGRLTGPGGVPIDAARIDVLATPAYAGAPPAAMASPLTGADGRFSVRLTAGTSSRTLRFAYSSSVGSPPVVTRTLTLSVRAGVSLRVAPRTASVGRSIYFSGRLRGGPIPSGGKPLVLEARSPGGTWLEFDVIRTDAQGRYHSSYRFKFPGPADYQFRVLCEAEADYPFATGGSRVVEVRER
jgi:hypothetical protein